jgi:hypothetical protein
MRSFQSAASSYWRLWAPSFPLKANAQDLGVGSIVKLIDALPSKGNPDPVAIDAKELVKQIATIRVVDQPNPATAARRVVNYIDSSGHQTKNAQRHVRRRSERSYS